MLTFLPTDMKVSQRKTIIIYSKRITGDDLEEILGKESVIKEDFRSRTLRINRKLIDENDEYMDDIISGLYGKK